MKIHSATSLEVESARAAKHLASSLRVEFGSTVPDLAFIFLSQHHIGSCEETLRAVQTEVGPRRLIGVTAESIVGEGEELLGRPAMSLWAASLPGVDIKTVGMQHAQTPDGLVLSGLHEVPRDARALIVFNDPFTFRVDDLLERVQEESPGLPVLGGMSSSAQQPGVNRLFIDDCVVDTGAVGVFLSGDIEVHPLVSQGCRPFGKPLIVTRCEENTIHELGGKRSFDGFREQAATLSKRELAILTRGLHLGRAVDSRQASDGRGEFLVRNVLALSEDSGAISIGDVPALGQTVQFHLRDPDSASEELASLLARAHTACGQRLAGALLFTCSGRGTRLFESEHHDAGAIQREFGNVPVSGFFAAGEIGPIGDENFLHGFTAVAALFVAPSD